MNVFKRFVEDLKKRLQFDVKFKDRGISFNVELDPSGTKEKSFSIAICGAGNPVGGLLLCCLESSLNTADSHLTPKMANMSNVFLFLNGSLLPSSAPSRITLMDVLEISKVNTEAAGCISEQSYDLDKGYRLSYKYINAQTINELLRSDSSLADFICNEFTTLLPSDKTAVFHNIYDDSDNLSEDDLSHTLMEDVSDSIGDAYQEIITNPEVDLTSLANYIAVYCYSNILRKIESEIANITKNSDISDIPWDNFEAGQTKWLAKLEKSIKDEAAWKEIQKRFVINWTEK